MQYEYQGWLFGHYDSRGGATFVVADTEDEARDYYAELGVGVTQTMKDAVEWASDPNAWEGWKDMASKVNDRKAFVLGMTEEDFLGKARITSYREIQEGDDLEYGNPDAEHIAANWSPLNSDEDAPETIEITLAEGKDPRPDEDGTLFGEDAYGLIVNFATKGQAK